MKSVLQLAGKLVRNPQFARFATVGLITTALDMLIFFALTKVAWFAIAPANICSYGFCVLVSFLLNRNWTFRKVGHESRWLAEAGKFLASNTAGLTLSTLLVLGFSFLMPDMAAKVLSVPIVFAWNYALARTWVFRSRRS